MACHDKRSHSVAVAGIGRQRADPVVISIAAIFLASLIGQAFVGHASFNHDQVAHHDETISLLRYVSSSAYAVDVLENWQSECLQFAG